MDNGKYTVLVSKWHEILNKAATFGGKVRALIIEPPATQEEISQIEKNLGFSLPLHFKEVLLNFSKHVELNWYMPDNVNLPHEFREIFSGEISWNLNAVEDLTLLAEELEDGLEDEDSGLRNKLQFLGVGNGDILAFDMVKGAEAPIIYWAHEGAESYYIADNFIDYIDNLTLLYGVGAEMWQFEMFLNEGGLTPNCLAAKRWRDWFDTFAIVSKKVETRDLDDVIKYIEYRGEILKRDLEVLKNYDQSYVFSKVQQRLKESEDYQKEILYKVIGEVLGGFAAEWVRNLWNDKVDINPICRSYLTAKCLPLEEGLNKVIPYVESQFTDKVKDYIAKEHLCHFRNYKVIDWIKGYISKGTTEDSWYSLYASSEPTWQQVKEWLELGGRYRMVTRNALEYMVKSWEPIPTYIKGQYRITNHPDKEEMIAILKKTRDEELLNSKKSVYNRIIEEIDCIL